MTYLTGKPSSLALYSMQNCSFLKFRSGGSCSPSPVVDALLDPFEVPYNYSITRKRRVGDCTGGASGNSSSCWSTKRGSMASKPSMSALTKLQASARYVGRRSPNGLRSLKCACGLVANRDIVGSWNIRLKGLELKKIDVGSPVPPRKPVDESRGGKVPR